MIPAITDFRAQGTIIGLAGLTAVFGMGTGVTPPVWSPEMRPAGGQSGPGACSLGGRVTRCERLSGIAEFEIRPAAAILSDRSVGSVRSVGSDAAAARRGILSGTALATNHEPPVSGERSVILSS